MRSKVSNLLNVVGLFGDGRHAFERPGVVPHPLVAICPESFKYLAAVIHGRRLVPSVSGYAAPWMPEGSRM